ncbi:MAG TPA: prenyltransferase/squalene oxidase repeat-containing protein [Gemmataceae bacterium]|nr:prenyltransferase/squalene oxidase repeat-containing protein [Gemmataceae bacterium]
MNLQVRIRLAALVAVTSGLLVLAVSKAEDKPKEPANPAEKKETTKTERVDPKPLSDAVKKGLEYLIKQQHENGGWGQGGGWRVNLDPKQQGGRIEGANVEDPADVGNTAIASLALIRAGNTLTEGPYAKQVKNAVDFLCDFIEKSDEKSLYVTNVKGTQIQSKIGPYVDTFLVNMVLAELKGKKADEKSEKRLVAALTKTISKIEKNQEKDGTFKGNNGWASVLSQGLANKSLARAAQNGAAVDGESLRRVQNQVASNFDGNSGTFRMAGGGAGGDGLGRGAVSGRSSSLGAGAGGIGGPSDAGVPIYGAGQNLTNSADVSAALKTKAEKAKETLNRKDATDKEKKEAEETIKLVERNEKLREEATKGVVKQLDQAQFVNGFGSNGGEEFLSYMNISEALLLKGGADWKKWDQKMTDNLVRVQDKDGSWSGHHCITGKTFCTATALLVLMADRAPIQPEQGCCESK